MLLKEGLPADRRAVLGVVAVDALPKGSTVELQLYAEETVQESVDVNSDDIRTSAVAKLERADAGWGMFGASGELFSRVMQERLETLSASSLVLQVAGRVGKHCVVHASVHAAPPITAIDQTTQRDGIRSTLFRVFAAAFEALRCSGLSTQSCVCARLFRHVDWAPMEGELAEATAAAATGVLTTAIVEVGTLHRGEPIVLHIVAAASSQQ